MATDYRSDKHCYNVTQNGVKYHIPCCWGCVIYGHDWCTCQTPKEADMIAKMNTLERRVAELEAVLAR